MDARRLLRQTSSLEGRQLDRVIRQATIKDDVISVDMLKEQFQGEAPQKSATPQDLTQEQQSTLVILQDKLDLGKDARTVF